MTVGLQIFKPETGQIKLDISSRYTRILGYIDIPATIWDYWGGSTQPVNPLTGEVWDGRLTDGELFIKGFFRLDETQVVTASGTIPGNINQLLREGHIYAFPDITLLNGGFRWAYNRSYMPVIGDPSYASWGGVRLFYGVF